MVQLPRTREEVEHLLDIARDQASKSRAPDYWHGVIDGLAYCTGDVPAPIAVWLLVDERFGSPAGVDLGDDPDGDLGEQRDLAEQRAAVRERYRPGSDHADQGLYVDEPIEREVTATDDDPDTEPHGFDRKATS